MYVRQSRFSTSRAIDRCPTRSESEESIMVRPWSMQVKGTTLALKPRADISRSLKQGYRWSHKNDWCPPEIQHIKYGVPAGFLSLNLTFYCSYGGWLYFNATECFLTLTVCFQWSVTSYKNSIYLANFANDMYPFKTILSEYYCQ